MENTPILRIMVASREMAALRPLWSLIELNSWQLEAVTTGWQALERIQSGICPHLLVLDAAKGDTDCMHILRWLRRLRAELPILLLCDSEDSSKRSDAMCMGADDVLVKPCPDHELEFAIYLHLGGSRQRAEHCVGAENTEPLGEDGYFVSESTLMRKVASQAELLAEVDVPVLILGEAGSGKEAVARLIHRLSVRSGFKFVKVNCAGMPAGLLEKEIFGADATGSSAAVPGRIEISDNGMLLISEITAVPSPLQAKLLYVICNGRYTRVGSDRFLTSHTRILISSNANIEHTLGNNRIREDLYQRAGEFTILVPPLRQRKEDIPVLLAHFMNRLATHYGLPKREISPSVVENCQNYSWPGNLDELETFVKRYVVSGDSDLALHPISIGARHGHATQNLFDQPDRPVPVETVPARATSLKSLIQTVKSEAEKTAIGLALEKTRWNRRAAARLLSISYRTLLYKIEQHHMSAPHPFSSILYFAACTLRPRESQHNTLE